MSVLEAFFAENQFPSRADKAFLAQKSNMTFNQIHVWVSLGLYSGSSQGPNICACSFKIAAIGGNSHLPIMPCHPKVFVLWVVI